MTAVIRQEGDVLLAQTFDGGDISVVDGIAEMSGGLETAAYLSLFGGNEDDSGRDGDKFTWWGNLDENESERQYRSETQHIVQSLPLITSNLRRVEDAAMRDLNWFLTGSIANLVEVVASVPALNTLQLDVRIEAVGEEFTFNFVENWKALQTRQIEIEPEPSTPTSVTQGYLLLEDDFNVLLESGDFLELEN